MKTASVKELKTELKDCSNSELIELVLQLSKFKKENKELLTYLLYMASDEDAYISNIKIEMTQLFNDINTSSYYFIRKSVRKILRIVKTYIRYSKKKETEVELLIYFCKELNNIQPSFKRNTTLKNLYERQILFIKKSIKTLHEDLQYDFTIELEKLNS
ncbi:hypothetical protein MHL31_02795 [Lutibacter sp. A80]|uniref:hypothetical protein n=1 Tax=Lutibacter sp. A80 TaxID=2918453 RepID=UPI001F064169|nr:hypothetical protein [Lutibacter sp. A80]UMB61140.1 hypothetical protein MHL31_02795 [Lutibacter sp. A80]